MSQHTIPPPQRILLIRPCCIGDVVLATAPLYALRRAYPNANITFAVNKHSQKAIEYHPAIDDILITGEQDLPIYSIPEFWGFVRQMRQGGYDLVISLVRSPLMSLAVRLSSIRYRVGLDSNRRGFGYNIRIPVNPDEPRHEADIYLDTVRAIGVDTIDSLADLPVPQEARDNVHLKLEQYGIRPRYIVINPAGGDNPGMRMHQKRWLPENFAMLATQLSKQFNAHVILIAGPDDTSLVQAVQSYLQIPSTAFIDELSFPEIGALASEALIYIGNDTGLTHLAAASGGKTAMILGPTDPQRYAPFTENSIALWKPINLQTRGVSTQSATHWDWKRDGISANEALEQILDFLNL